MHHTQTSATAPRRQRRDQHAIPAPTQAPDPAPTLDFTPVSRLVNDAIEAHRLPGAVVLIGHAGKIVFRQAFGSRKLAGEPGLDG